MVSFEVRPASGEDAEAIARIYNYMADGARWRSLQVQDTCVQVLTSQSVAAELSFYVTCLSRKVMVSTGEWT
jgi:hypothetical protein